ncbi:MAG: hypothetical protein AMK69_20555 [Nitrospira bacterium SG8_3]|nr:MAG: hypothetical protein AMK69_20555 [Nitrospira bacterium SG8_3]
MALESWACGLKLAPLNSSPRAGPFNWGAAVLESRLVGMHLERSGPQAQPTGSEFFLFRLPRGIRRPVGDYSTGVFSKFPLFRDYCLSNFLLDNISCFSL